MLKKYFKLYLESLRLAIAFPLVAIFYVASNATLFLELIHLNDFWMSVLYLASLIVKIAVMAVVGYVTIRLLRSGQMPEKIFKRGMVGYYWPMAKYFLLQLVITGVTYFLPTTLLGRWITYPAMVQQFWYWIADYMFVFLIYEAFFWEEKKVLQAYRMRNVFMLDRFEWVRPVYIVARLPHFIVALWGPAWMFSGLGIIGLLAALAAFDWVNNIFTFKVYGVDRLQVSREMEERVREAEKRRKEMRRDRREKVKA